MKIYKLGYQIVILPDGETEEQFITSAHTRMEFVGDTVFITDVATLKQPSLVDNNYQYVSSQTNPGGYINETFSCDVSAVEDVNGDPVGDKDAVKTYLCDIIGS